MTTVLAPWARLAIAGVFSDAVIKDGRCSLDATRVPYGAAEVTISTADLAVIEALDPRGTQRGTVTLSTGIGSRSFNLSLQDRVVDHDTREAKLTLTTDEALLQQWYPLTVDTGALAYQTSIRAVCDYVLGKIGASLAPGAPDFDATAYWRVTNLLTEPSHEGALGWVAGTNATALGPATPARSGSVAARWTAPAAGITWMDTAGPIRVDQGRTYTISTYMRSTSSINGRFMVRFRNDAGVILQETYSPNRSLSTPYRRLVYSVTAPPGATQATLHIGAITTAANQQVWNDDAMFYEGAEEIPFFSGATANDANYTYTWSGVAQQSTSTRTPVIPRPLELYTWKPNTSAWDFLMSLVGSFGLRLFCDEKRIWQLIDPATYTVGGEVTVGTENGRNPANATGGTDTISRNDDAWCTGVCVHYQWKDRNGIDQEAYDTAGTAGRVRYVPIERPSPGPGLAAAILSRAADQGRVQSVTALADRLATPAMNLAVTMPGTKPQRARVASVEWDLRTALMTVTGRNGRTVPAAPAAPTVTGTGALAISWTAPDSGGLPITGYVLSVQAFEPDEGDSVPVSGTSTSYTPWRSGRFRFRVSAVNAVGRGPASPPTDLTIP